MTDAAYVLCRWKERLWPAKVLARTQVSATAKRKKGFFLNVQILSVDKKVRVRSTEARTLEKSHIEDIASLLASQKDVPAEPVEELTYRRALRVALDILNEGTCLRPEDTAQGEGAAGCAGGDPTDSITAHCDPSPPPPVPAVVPASSGPERRERVRQSLAGSPTCGEDPRCRGDPEKRLGENERPLALVVSARGGSRTHLEDWPAPSRRTRSSPRQPRGRQPGPLLSEGGRGKGDEDSPGRGAAPGSAPQARERGLRARACHEAWPGDGPPVRPACPDTQGPAAKQLCLAGGLDSGPRGRMTLRSTPKPGVPVDGSRLRVPDEDGRSSGESVESDPVHPILEDEDEDEDEEPPRILLYHEPRSFEVGMLVWLKYQKYPFWPAVVKSVRRRDKKASVLFIEGHMNPRGRGITVPLKRLKHFDCKDKQALLDEAKADFNQAIGWCVSLITDYRVRLGCGSFSGSFLEYYAADISYPVRKSIQQDVLGTRFPQLCQEDPEEPEAGSPWGRRPPRRKVLPDRSRAARDRANQKLVEFIVRARGAEGHLRDILRNRKPSRWLKTFLRSGQYVTCVETYLEDEEQLDRVVKYLQGLCQDADGRALARSSGDRIRFILDVLLPEAIICAISAVDAVDYKTAEEKYIRGPSLGHREKEIFDNQLLEERTQRS
ncbi:PWWP domain-containing DNA repair factor 3A [Pteropus medius]|uniref:PWWP domain-containing DNA repair factor 3A n=1 Tax=Pteropus vampyrus TaxID=132908 RepID=UPI00196A93B6|nr:PWWP domain-containing DNA repair factor 3A [Pteropus giganteus]XP_039694993.1 PWWP domain-containing DNA repair factor 3A [Pteropus giganteus]